MILFSKCVYDAMCLATGRILALQNTGFVVKLFVSPAAFTLCNKAERLMGRRERREVT